MRVSDRAVFIVRRALWFTLLNFVFGIVLLAMAAANLVELVRSGGSWAVALLLILIAGVYAAQAFAQMRSRANLIEIGPAGLRLPTASEAPIEWSRIWQIEIGRGLPGLTGGRLHFQVDIDTFARLRFGQRFMGDNVVRRRGYPNAFTVITQGLDENATAIYAAIKRFWPPDARSSDSDSEDV